MNDSRITRRGFFGSALGVAGVAAVAATGLTSCGTGNSSSAAQAGANTPRPVILVTSFGTSYGNCRHITIGAIESDIDEAFAKYDVRRAFTSQTIIDHIQKDTGRHIDNFTEAMDKLVAEGVKEVIVQPTHLTDGYEYNDIATALENYRSKFDKCGIGTPLLKTKDDQKAVAQAIKNATKSREDEHTCVCLMGHGTEAEANKIYTEFQATLNELGYKNYFVATVEASPSFDDVAAAAKQAGYTRAILRPLMVVAGDHANNDMADTGNDHSFASIMQASGFEVESIVEGLGQIEAVDEVYVQHTQEVINHL